MLRCLLLGGCFLLTAFTAQAQIASGKVEWARLKTLSPSWNRHAASDPTLLRFIRSATTLNIDPVWKSADVENLSQMTAYPFLFSEGLQYVTDPAGQKNLREYVQRGGFIFIDSCINTDVNPNPDVFIQSQIATLQAALPDVRIEDIPANHEIFHNCFDMQELPHTYMNNHFNEDWHRHGLQAVYSQNRLVGIISVSGLQCGWAAMDPDVDHITDCMKMMVNIYVYAITH